MLKLTDLLRVPHIDNDFNFDISPDEQRLVFTWNKTGKWDLYERRLDDDSAPATPLQVSQKLGSKFSPSHAPRPDGIMLAYALDLDGSESYHIVVHNLNTNTCTDLTPRIAYAQQPHISWS